ncbi:farnesyl cysteine-carboxyl methyltransferase [Tieghemiomyces parasiticus]|uniref:Protein-S-isoprenylcysteine O-methyltransferase n=1 Tax=Tieghemiomyces parasiticus TaxID=78921 RepID=A0A9W8ADV3_9FUNG|nr:farnesyl cysteine-carboxyl methyltransferase [Tieghemiomyces parasiticus]
MTSIFAELTQLPRPTSEISSAGESWAVNQAPTAKGEKKPTDNSLWAMFRPAVSLGDGRHTPQNVSLTSFLLGIGLGVGFLWTWSALCAVVIPEETKPGFSQALLRLGPFLLFLSQFHYLEYLITSLYNPKALGFDTFTFTMDANYIYLKMMSIILIEFLVEAYFVPEIKMGRWNWLAGLTLMITGQAIRTLAMATTQRNFNHYVATEKDPDHVLVTHGIYR